jgi:hypothetical protein
MHCRLLLGDIHSEQPTFLATGEASNELKKFVILRHARRDGYVEGPCVARFVTLKERAVYVN